MELERPTYESAQPKEGLWMKIWSIGFYKNLQGSNARHLLYVLTYAVDSRLYPHQPQQYLKTRFHLHS